MLVFFFAFLANAGVADEKTNVVTSNNATKILMDIFYLKKMKPIKNVITLAKNVILMEMNFIIIA